MTKRFDVNSSSDTNYSFDVNSSSDISYSYEDIEIEKLQRQVKSLTNKLVRYKKVNDETISIMETKIMSMQKQISECDELLETTTTQLIELKEQKKIFQELYTSASQKLEKSADLEYLCKKQKEMLEAIDKPNPKLAIEMIKKNNKDTYMYSCKTLESKMELLEEAKLTNDPIVIVIVIIFLNFSLESNLFGTLVMNNETYASFYLQYLLSVNYEDYEIYCLRYKKIKEYAKEKVKRAFAIKNDIGRHHELGICLKFCEQYPEELSHLILLINNAT